MSLKSVKLQRKLICKADLFNKPKPNTKKMFFKYIFESKMHESAFHFQNPWFDVEKAGGFGVMTDLWVSSLQLV